MNKICVFSSSSDAIDKEYFETAKELGILLGKQKLTLIHGGAKVGLMGALAKNVQQNGGKVIGIIPEKLKIKGVITETDDELITTPDMHTRKEIMRSNSDAFICLTGGFGTLEEILEVITLKQLKYHSKPIVFINTKNYFDSLLEMFEKAYSEKFALADFRKLYFVTKSPKEAIEHIMNYEYFEIRDKWI
jgi:uncharacterized protein (TIGR00730 family)